jgi:hypothetical protein
VVTLTPGATFGELCLIEPDSKRSATVIVDPQAQMANFIVLTAASYLRMTRSQTIEVRCVVLHCCRITRSNCDFLGHYHRQHRVSAASAHFQELDQDAYVAPLSWLEPVAIGFHSAWFAELMHIVNSMKLVNVSAGVRSLFNAVLRVLSPHQLQYSRSNT